ncbi:hypothetical protein [Marinobacter salicampi]|uniref:hypothetical protein n=1 Tax=Marinobacter salicampi TaxID=435907 RepID=UPI001409C597|nr:hypothetical protein [Marinobacter salicampi]
MKNQVTLIEITGHDDGMALFVNGSQTITADTRAGFSMAQTRLAAQALAESLQVTLQTLRFPITEYGQTWSWVEIQANLIHSKAMVPPASGHFMKGFYRCERCYTQWHRVDDTNEAQTCNNCGKDDVEPFCSADPDTSGDDPMVIKALADHERRYPSPLETGSYEVYVTRSAAQQACIQIQNAAGPATAQLAALDQAPDIDFQRESVSDYEANGWVGQGLLSKGLTVWWEDPDESAGSCEAEVVDVGDDEICLGRPGTGTFWVPAREVKRL